MASNTIDELQLQIGSDATEAIRQLGNLSAALNIAAESAGRLGSASTNLQKFASGIERIGSANFSRAIDNLTKLSRINLNNLKNTNIDFKVKVSGMEDAERLKYAQADAAKDIAKNSMTIAKALGQKYDVDTEGVKELSKLVKDLATDLGNGGNGANAQKAIFESIKANGRESEAQLMGLADEYKSFLSELSNTHFSSTGIKDIVGKGEAQSASGLLRNMRKDAESADSALSELFSKFPTLFSDFRGSLDNPADMLQAVVEKAQEARAMLEPHEIVDDSTFDNIGASIQQMATDMYSKLDGLTNEYMKRSANQIPIDLAIDQRRFERQIQTAINEATKIEYSSKPIKINIDTDKLKSDISSVIRSVDAKNLPEFANNFDKVSSAISAMNQMSIKDTGVTEFTNAIGRLMNVDSSKFDAKILSTITAEIERMSQIGDVSNSLNRFVSAIARLANAGDKTKKSADGMKVLSVRLVDTVKSLIGVGEINPTISQFVSSLAKLATAGDKTAKTASNLKALTTAVVDFINSLKNAPEINDNLAMTINGLGNLASAGVKTGKALGTIGSGGGGSGSFGTAIGSASHIASNGLKKLLNVSLSLGGRGASALGSFMGRLGLIPHHTANVNRMALTFGNLLRAVIPFYGLRGIFDWAKNSFELGSSIVEIQNVVDTAFGSLKRGYEDISGYIYKWSKTTIDSFGVSELAALQYAGRLQSIFNSSGFDVTEGMRDSAAKMSTDLIERAGDIASFYDITVDEAMTKITSGLAGMSRPLRSLGVNMSVANLEAFALSQGITTSWKSMDQATQMALRYQYILNATQYAEGDFGRTAMSAANQVRLLQLNMQVLSSTIGQGFVSAIAPAISWLNALIRRLIQAANAFRTFMWTLFGKPLAAARGVADDLFGSIEDSADAVGDLGGGAGGASDGLGKAGKAAKELKKQLTVLPFDELNQLAKDTDSASSGGSGGGGGGGGGGLGGLDTSGLIPDFTADLDNSPALDAINEWARRIRMAFVQRDWGKLGLTIADGINKGFKKLYDLLDWDNWKDRIYNFIQPFQATINSLVSGLDFDLIGRTFARGLNLVTRTFRMWINGFNWRQWGKKFAEGLNGLLDEWDADAFGRAIADKFRAAWNFFGGFVENFDFSGLGTKIKEAIVGALDELNFADMGETFGGFITGIADSISSALKDGELRKKATEALTDFTNGFIKGFDGNKVKEALKLLADTVVGILGDTIKGVDKGALADDFKEVLEGLPWGTIFGGLGAIAGGKLAASLIGTAFKNKAKAILEAEFPSLFGGNTGGSAGAKAGVSTAETVSGLSLGEVVAGTLAVTAITIGAIELGKYIKEKGWGQLNTEGNKQNAAKATAEGQTKNQKALEKAGTNGAGYSTKIQTVPQTGSKGTNTTNTVKTVMKASVDTSMKQADTMVQGLKKDPVITKILKGDTKQSLITGSDMFHALMNGTATKTIMGKVNSSYATTETRYGKLQDGRATKTVYGSRTAGFDTTYTRYIAVKTERATKKVTAEKTSQFDSILTKWNGFSDKWVKLHVQADLSGMVKKIRAWQSDNDYKNILWTTIDYYAKGGLFTGPTGMAVFGEAGSEAAIPLERKSTMKKIASAIVDSGGFNTGTNSDLANDIAVRVAPIIMDAMASQNQRPINVNATLYTENNEVLAKAVNRGNRSLDKRYHPVAQYSY